MFEAKKYIEKKNNGHSGFESAYLAIFCWVMGDRQDETVYSDN